MLGVMAMAVLGEASLAQIIVLTSRAVEELTLGQFYAALLVTNIHPERHILMLMKSE